MHSLSLNHFHNFLVLLLQMMINQINLKNFQNVLIIFHAITAHSGLMSNTAHSSSTQQPLTSLVSGVNSSLLYNQHHHHFQPIQRQPLVRNGAISEAIRDFDVAKVNFKSTATHIELEQQSNCTFSSLINMSCRGRAEAFARSLQSRLKTLGSHVSEN